MILLLIVACVVVAYFVLKQGSTWPPRESAEAGERARFAFARSVELDVDATLAGLGLPRLHEVWVADRRDRSIEIDHLALCGDAILVVETKGWKGRIEIDSTTGDWRQVKRQETKVHRSPLGQSARQIRVLQSVYRAARFQPVVLMPYADFATLPPPEVWSLERLAATAERQRHLPTGAETLAAWSRLVELDGQQDKAGLRASRGRNRAPAVQRVH